MTTLLLLLATIGLAPLAVGVALLKPSPYGTWPRLDAGSVLLCALAFNLTFFWQELWLVMPKAMTPGLHPILYHNNHDWTGAAPDVELLQGTGALATLASGAAFAGGLAIARRASVTWRLFLFWMAFQGLYQSLTQLAIGTLLPGNDVGRALAYLHVGALAKWTLFGLTIAAMAFAGALLVRASPLGGEQRTTGRTRAFAYQMLLTAMAATALIVPFRLPRDMVEVALIPLFVNLVGVGWLAVGAKIVRGCGTSEDHERSGIVGPTLALGVTLLLFQFVLRPGVAF
jgi:hypothetical protein